MSFMNQSGVLCLTNRFSSRNRTGEAATLSATRNSDYEHHNECVVELNKTRARTVVLEEELSMANSIKTELQESAAIAAETIAELNKTCSRIGILEEELSKVNSLKAELQQSATIAAETIAELRSELALRDKTWLRRAADQLYVIRSMLSA